ncbi:hypothetical protein IAU60_005316 [Kwoniella sp. DSM 27419]
MSTFKPFGSAGSWSPPNIPPAQTPSGLSIKTLSRQTTPPSEVASPVVATPNDLTETLWSDRYRSMSTGSLNINISDQLSMNVPLPLSGFGERRTLGEIQHNQVTPHALASPFMPGINSGAWGPPIASTKYTAQRGISLEERLAMAEDKIRELTVENARLRERNVYSHRAYNSIPSNSHTSMYDHSQSAFSGGFGQTPGLGLNRFEDPEVCYTFPKGIFEEPDLNKATYQAPAHIAAGLLQGTLNILEMPAEYMRPVVWVIAHHIPKSNSESASLKAAVNALATRLGQPRQMDPAKNVVLCIIEWAKPLCFTSCGNYLCQQLLERGDVEDKQAFVKEIQDDIVPIASDKFGTHVLCKAIAIKELEDTISEALIKFGIFDSMRTGARRLWREYLEKCRQAKQLDIFHKINEAMQGRWAALACVNEHGSIAVQQIFEVFGSPDLMQPCFKELIADIARVANNQFGHFVVTKLIGYPNLYRPTCDAILTSYPPVATSHHGVNFAKIALTEGGRGSMVKYVEAICSFEDGRTPGIVAIATSSIGKAHLIFVLSCLTPAEHVRVRHTCRAYSTTLRNSQSGNDLLRSLGIIHTVGVRHRAGSS